MSVTRGNAEYPCAVDGCGLQAHERRICGVCTGNLERDLAEMPALLSDLSVTLSRQARIGGRNGSRSAEVPLPYDPRASEAGDVLRSTLVGWVRDLHDGAELYPTDSLHGMALWLYVRRHRLFDHKAADEAVDEIGAAVRLCRQVTDRPLAKVYAGTCGVDGCAEALYAKPMSAEVDCPGCGTRHSVVERRDTMRAEVDEMLLTASQISRLGSYFDGLPQERVRKLIDAWELRGRILAHGVSRDGVPTYPFGATIAAVLHAQATRRSA